MPYTPTDWKSRIVEFPNRFKLTDLGYGLVNLVPDPGVVTEFGTLVDQENMNKLENGMSEAHAHLLPPGAIIYTAMPVPPEGCLKANGAAVSRTAYANLFAAIGTTFGVGDNSTTFNLPDLRGEFIRCFDDGRGIDSGRAFGSWQADDLKSHTHTVPFSDVNTYANNSSPGELVMGNTPTISSATGGIETRPRNIALLACIKY